MFDILNMRSQFSSRTSSWYLLRSSGYLGRYRGRFTSPVAFQRRRLNGQSGRQTAGTLVSADLI
jgi:hypothetical protein